MNKFFELVVSEHQNAVFCFLFSIVRDRQRAEDLTQETFLVLVKKIDGIDTSRPILPWLLTTARNLALNARRKDFKERRLFVEGDAIQAFWEGLGRNDLGRAWQDTLEALRACRDALPAPQKDVVDLFYSEGIDCQTIGDRLGTAAAAVYNRLTRARNALRQCLNRKLGTES